MRMSLSAGGGSSLEQTLLMMTSCLRSREREKKRHAIDWAGDLESNSTYVRVHRDASILIDSDEIHS